MRKRYLISLIVITILIIIIGILIGISFLNLGYKKIYKSDYFQNGNIKTNIEEQTEIKENDIIENNISEEHKKNHNLEDENVDKQNIEKIEITEEIQSQIYDAVYNQLYILWNKNSINEIKNSEKVQIAFDLYKKAKNVKHFVEEEIDGNIIENFYSQSLFSIYPFHHEDLKAYIYLSYPGLYSYLYIKDNNKYIRQVDGCDLSVVMPASQKIIGLYKKSNKVVLQMKYIWINHPDVGPILTIYKSYEDAESIKNEIWKTDYDGYTITSLESYEDYINNNQDYLYSLVESYNYIFELKNDEYKLVDFYRE